MYQRLRPFPSIKPIFVGSNSCINFMALLSWLTTASWKAYRSKSYKPMKFTLTDTRFFTPCRKNTSLLCRDLVNLRRWESEQLMPPAVGKLNYSHQKHATDNISQCSKSLKFEKLNPGDLIGFCKESHEHFYGTHDAMMQSCNAY